MKESNLVTLGRRNFLSKVMSVCAVSCLGTGKLLCMNPKITENLMQPEKHKFDTEIPNMKLTPRALLGFQNQNFIKFARFLELELGKEKMLELVKKSATHELLKVGKMQAKQFGKTNLKAYTAQFKGPRAQSALTHKIIEDTDKVFEIEVTECLVAAVFLQEKAADIGYASVCWGDYAWAEGFNPKIKLIRDKTLMQGDAYCNHKYVLEE